jgi:hypothetical protein
LYALKTVNALPITDIEVLYTRFITNNDNPEYWRAWWDGIRHAIPNLDAEPYRTTILSQLERTEWKKLHVRADSTGVLNTILALVDAGLATATTNSSTEWDYMPYINTLQSLLRTVFALDVEDRTFRDNCINALTKIFQYYPKNGDERTRLAEEIFKKAATGPVDQRGGDLLVVRALLYAESADTVTLWKREECTHRLCMQKPSLPEVILGELATWKKQRYSLGMENVDRQGHVMVWVQFFLHILLFDRQVLGGYVFPREVLEEFWNSALMRSGNGGNERLYWGGDSITDMMRVMFFHLLSREDLKRFSGLVWVLL